MKFTLGPALLVSLTMALVGCADIGKDESTIAMENGFRDAKNAALWLSIYHQMQNDKLEREHTQANQALDLEIRRAAWPWLVGLLYGLVGVLGLATHRWFQVARLRAETARLRAEAGLIGHRQRSADGAGTGASAATAAAPASAATATASAPAATPPPTVITPETWPTPAQARMSA